MADVGALLTTEFSKFCLRHEPGHFLPLAGLIGTLFPLQNLRIMEFGCGTGDLGLALLKAGARQLTGVDISGPGIEEARRQAKDIPAAAFYCQDLMKEPWIGQPFDLLVSHSTIHYIALPVADMVQRLSGLLVPGGGLFLTVETLAGSSWLNALQRLNLRFLPEWLRAKLYLPLLPLLAFKKGLGQGLEDREILKAKCRYLSIPVLHRLSEESLQVAAQKAGLVEIKTGHVPTMHPLQTPHIYLAARRPSAS